MLKYAPKTMKEARSLKEIPDGKSYCAVLTPNAIMFFYDGIEDKRWAVVRGEDNFYYKTRG